MFYHCKNLFLEFNKGRRISGIWDCWASLPPLGGTGHWQTKKAVGKQSITSPNTNNTYNFRKSMFEVDHKLRGVGLVSLDGLQENNCIVSITIIIIFHQWNQRPLGNFKWVQMNDRQHSKHHRQQTHKTKTIESVHPQLHRPKSEIQAITCITEIRELLNQLKVL